MAVSGTVESSRAQITLPLWMCARREQSLYCFARHLHRNSGKLYISRESLVTLANDLELLPHEIDRAIDDLFFLKLIEVRGDHLTHAITLVGDLARIVWRINDL